MRPKPPNVETAAQVSRCWSDSVSRTRQESRSKLCVEVVCVGLQLLVGCVCRLLQIMVKSSRPGSIGRLMRRFCMLSSCSAYLASPNRVCFFSAPYV